MSQLLGSARLMKCDFFCTSSCPTCIHLHQRKRLPNGVPADKRHLPYDTLPVVFSSPARIEPTLAHTSAGITGDQGTTLPPLCPRHSDREDAYEGLRESSDHRRLSRARTHD